LSGRLIGPNTFSSNSIPGVTPSRLRRDGKISAVSTRRSDMSVPRVFGRLDDRVVRGQHLVPVGVGEHRLVGHETHLSPALAFFGEVLADPHRSVERFAG